MRQQLLDAFKKQCEGNIEKHKVNIEVYLTHPVGIGEHPDIMEAIEQEMNKLAEWDELLGTCNKYFN